MNVAYLLHRFPHLTETFIMNEMYWIREHGINIQVFSLMPPKHEVVHDVAKALVPVTHYSALLSWAVLGSQLQFLRRSPRRYWRALMHVIRQTYREPKVALLALTLFPKSVHFAKQMEQMGIDHIHAHFVWLGGISAGVISELVDISFSLHPHAFGLFQRNQRNSQYELESASYIVTISAYHQAYISELCPRIRPENLHVVHLGIDTERAIPIADETVCAQDQTVRLLTIGRPIEKKGHPYLIEACAYLAKQGLTFHCNMLVGRGEESEALQQLINRHHLQDYVTLLDFRDQDGIIKLYQDSHIFALACVVAEDGDRDGMPLVLLEAMSCGLPVVTTPVSGIPDLVSHGENGLLVQERDAQSMAIALEQLIEDAALRQQLGKQARQTIQETFDIQYTTSCLAQVFRQHHDSHIGSGISVDMSANSSQGRRV